MTSVKLGIKQFHDCVATYNEVAIAAQNRLRLLNAVSFPRSSTPEVLYLIYSYGG